MTASRILLIVAAVLVVGLTLGLVFALRGERSPRPVAVAPAEPPAHPQPPPAPSANPSPAPPPAAPAPPPRPMPNPPTTSAPEPPEAPIIRDHRGEGGPVRQGGLLPDTMVSARNAVTPDVQACGAAVTQISDAGRIHFFVHATYHVAGGRITATGVEIDGAGSLGPDYADCVRRAFGALGAPAPAGQPDGDELVHLPFVAP